MSNSGAPQRLSLATLIAVIGIGLLVATLANGASTYLKRVGLLDSPAYATYFSGFCTAVAHSGAGRCCVVRAPGNGDLLQEQGQGARTASAYIYKNAGADRLLKVIKDVLALGFILLSAHLAIRDRATVQVTRFSAPLVFLAVAVSLAFVATILLDGGGMAIAGLRPFLFVAIAMLGSWSVAGLPALSGWVAAALLSQLLLVPYKWLHGMPLRFCPNSLRAAGTLVLPNSLGVFAVTASAFCVAFVPVISARIVLLVAALILVMASGSATGLVALLAVASTLAIGESTRERRVPVAMVCAAVFLLLIPALPILTGRADLFASIFGTNARLDSLSDAWRSADPLQTLLGNGLGAGSNLSANLAGSAARPLDSGVAALFSQLGLFGLTSFYATLAWGFLRRAGLRPFFIAVALGSVTLNVTELFPLNFLLGLALAASLYRAPERKAA